MFQDKGSYFNYSFIIQLGAHSAVVQTEIDSQGENSDLGADLPKGDKKNLYRISLPFGGLGSHFYSTQKYLRYSNKKVKKVKYEALTD